LNAVTLGIVLFGLVAVVLAAAGGGVDAVAIVLIALVLALGVLSVVVARKSRAGAVQPYVCSQCSGLNSPKAPYCKHCGAPIS
jgi:hypothetical protein